MVLEHGVAVGSTCVTHIVRLVLEFILNACTRTEVSAVSMVHGYIYDLDFDYLHFKYNIFDFTIGTRMPTTQNPNRSCKMMCFCDKKAA